MDSLLEGFASKLSGVHQSGSSPSLKGATMPNGQKYEDWLKSKGHEEGG
jgi:hypothetical protein